MFFKTDMWPSCITRGYTLKELSRYTTRDACTYMLITAVLAITKKEIHSKCHRHMDKQYVVQVDFSATKKH